MRCLTQGEYSYNAGLQKHVFVITGRGELEWLFSNQLIYRGRGPTRVPYQRGAFLLRYGDGTVSARFLPAFREVQ